MENGGSGSYLSRFKSVEVVNNNGVVLSLIKWFKCLVHRNDDVVTSVKVTNSKSCLCPFTVLCNIKFIPWLLLLSYIVCELQEIVNFCRDRPSSVKLYSMLSCWSQMQFLLLMT